MRSSDRNEEAYMRRQYKTQDNLNVRVRTHQRYGEPQIDFADWVLDQIEWRGDEAVLDVGCGSGIYAHPARRRGAHYFAGDLSLGMLRKLESGGGERVNLNAQALPIAADRIDVLLANHMLYHVPDQQAALSEFSRVLRPGGYLLAATNSGRSMAAFRALSKQALAALGVEAAGDVRPRLSFTLENGRELLAPYFASVQRRDLPGALIFPEPAPVIAYLASSRERFEAALPAALSWEDMSDALHQILSTHIAAQGVFRVDKLTGVFVCHNE